jgi:hypothetical protein
MIPTHCACPQQWREICPVLENIVIEIRPVLLDSVVTEFVTPSRNLAQIIVVEMASVFFMTMPVTWFMNALLLVLVA